VLTLQVGMNIPVLRAFDIRAIGEPQAMGLLAETGITEDPAFTPEGPRARSCRVQRRSG
jgi:hypothetical protein